MAADLFESYAVTLVAALILGKVAFGEEGLVFPLIVTAIGAITAVIGVFITKVRKGESGLTAINRGFYISADRRRGARRDRGLRLPARHVRGLRRLARARRPDRRPRPAASSPRSPCSSASCSPAIILWLTGYFTDTDKRPTDRRRAHLSDRRGDRGARRASASASSPPSTPRSIIAGGGLRRCSCSPAARSRSSLFLDRARRLRPAHHGRRHRRHGHLRPGQRQRAGHRRDVRRRGRGGRARSSRTSTPSATPPRPSPRASRSRRPCWPPRRCSARTPTRWRPRSANGRAVRSELAGDLLESTTRSSTRSPSSA